MTRHINTLLSLSLALVIMLSVSVLNAANTDDTYRTWKSTVGTSIEAQLIKDAAGMVTLKSRTGRTINVRRHALSLADRKHLDALRRKPKAAVPTKTVSYASAEQVCVVSDPKITEASGLACSRIMPDAFWTHNDSGDGPNLFLINSEGKTLTLQTLSGAKTRDWEDMTSFKLKNQSYLLVADVGDNAAKRTECHLYFAKEPRVDPTKRKDGALNLEMTIRFEYEDGPHNCESIGVDVSANKIYLVAKESAKECKVFELPLPSKSPKDILTAKSIAVLAIPTTTAMDISPSGRRAVVLTYGKAYEYSRNADESWAEAFARKPKILNMPRRKQGEAIAYGEDGQSLYLVSEGVSQPMWKVPAVIDE